MPHRWVGHDTSQKESLGKKVARRAACSRGTQNNRDVLGFDDFTKQSGGKDILTTHGGFIFSNGFQQTANQSMKYVPSSTPGMLYYEQPGSDAIEHAVVSVREKCDRFSLRSWSLGCDSSDLPCEFEITGMRPTGKDEEDSLVQSKVATQTFTIQPCDQEKGCKLSPIALDPLEFANLVSFTVKLSVGGDQSRAWWADDLSVTYSCAESAACRSDTR